MFSVASYNIDILFKIKIVKKMQSFVNTFKDWNTMQLSKIKIILKRRVGNEEFSRFEVNKERFSMMS